MKIAKFQYKCRQCGIIEENPCTPEKSAHMILNCALLEYTPPALKVSGNPVTMTNTHRCGDGNCGVSDLIGYKVMEE